jgi:hypothetical protein
MTVIKHAAVAAMVAGMALGGSTLNAAASARPAKPPACNQGEPIYHIGHNETIKNCTLSGYSGTSPGAAIYNRGTLTLINVTVEDNSVTGTGGPIFNSGKLNIQDSTVIDNSVSGGSGGAIYNDGGLVRLRDSTFKDNSATGGDGGAVWSSKTLVLKGTIMEHNTVTDGNGGAIFNASGTVLLKGLKQHTAVSKVMFNTASTSTDARNLVNGRGRRAQNGLGEGGGIYNDDGTVAGVDTIMRRNSAVDGGSIFSFGGTIETADMAIIQSSASDSGGGLYLADTDWCCSHLDGKDDNSENTTLAGNSAGAEGGAVFASNSNIDLMGVTIADNSAGAAGGIDTNDSGGDTDLWGVLIARNTPDNCDISTTLNDENYNLDTGTSCELDGSGDISSVGDANVGLNALHPRGKHQWADTLIAGSPAIDAWPTAQCVRTVDSEPAGQLPRDQLDHTRPQGSACDIGAIEYTAPRS